MAQHITVASCSLNQWALDWEGNLSRIKASIIEAKAAGAKLRVGPELEVSDRISFSYTTSRSCSCADGTQICSYGCLDHFLEDDVYTNSWHMLLEILEDEACNDILLDIGMPVKHGRQRLNW